MGITKFWYRNTIESPGEVVLSDSEFWVNDCPVFPFTTALVQNATSSQFQDNYVISRPVTSVNLSLYTLNFVAVKEIEMLTVKKLEHLVRGSGTFLWLPTVPMKYTDLNPDGSLKPEGDRLLSVRFVSSIKYNLDAYQLYSFTMNLQEADKYS